MIRLFLLASATVLIAACAGGPKPVGGTAKAAASAVSAVPKEGLPPQELKPGQCGLFLWGMSAPRKFVFFKEGTSRTALILVDGVAISIPMTSAGGDVFGQFMTQMKFVSSASGQTVIATIEPGQPLDGGQRVESGNLLFRNADAWETVMPVTGVRACLPG
ncbi:MAG: hypothetical protein Q8S09_09340 [Hyphomonas sp.]|nr:hypothetical protein [Hyphomonas sp.]